MNTYSPEMHSPIATDQAIAQPFASQKGDPSTIVIAARALLVALFFTYSHRLLPVPLSDTVVGFLTALAVTLVCLPLSLQFLKTMAPLLVLMALAAFFDVIFGRAGKYLVINLVQFSGALLVGACLARKSFREIRLVVLFCVALLLCYLAFSLFAPRALAEIGARIGVVDSFTIYGADLIRHYYLYFHANVAAYGIYYILLSLLAIQTVAPMSRLKFAGCVLSMLVLIMLTGGRGGALLAFGAIACWLMTYQSLRFTAVLSFVAVGWVLVLPAAGFIAEIFGMRPESNVARVAAAQAYFDFIAENWIFGSGIDFLRERVSVYGAKPSHNFFIELLAMFGVFIGGAIATFMILTLVVRPADVRLKVIGLFGILSFFFVNTHLSVATFFGFLFPVIVICSRALRLSKGDNSTFATPIQPAQSHDPMPGLQPGWPGQRAY